MQRRKVFGCMFRIVIVVTVILFLLVSPFLFARLYNNYVLWRFASQSSLIEELFEKHDLKYRRLARGGDIMSHTNGESCGFRAVLVYDVSLYISAEKIFTEEVKEIDFDAALNPDYKKVEVYTYLNNSILTVILSDGPYGPGLDIRCW